MASLSKVVTIFLFGLVGLANAFHTTGWTVKRESRMSSSGKGFAPANEPKPDGDDVLGEEYLNQMKEEDKKNLFGFLLRDLQLEGVPLLGCDANQVHTFQAAIWTTMTELIEKDEEDKVCMIFEDIPVNAIRMFVDDYLLLLNNQKELVDTGMPELNRISLSLVAKGVGPAIVLESTNKTDTDKANELPPATNLNEFACSAAMKSFVRRVVQGGEDSIGLGSEGLAPGLVDYRYTDSANICSIMTAFWNCVCEMLSDDTMANTMLLLPGVGMTEASHARFAAVTHLMSRSLCLYQGDAVLSLVHFHPFYKRSDIPPYNQPAFGHLPPTSWLRPMMTKQGDNELLSSMDEETLATLSDFQHRSPITAVNLMRNALLEEPRIVELEHPSGEMIRASGLETYYPSIQKLAQIGQAELEETLQFEMKTIQDSAM